MINLANKFCFWLKSGWGFLRFLVRRFFVFLWAKYREGEFFRFLSQFFLLLFVFIFPFNIRTLIWTEGLFLNGNFDDFSAFFVYGNDLILGLSFLCFALDVLWRRRVVDFGKYWGILLVVVFFLLNFHVLFVALDPVLAYLHFFRWVLFGVFVFLLAQNLVSREKIVTVFVWSMAIQALIAVIQYVLQSSVGLGFLGEATIGPLVPGVAKFEVMGYKIMRAYGTFLHANILGGALVVAIFLTFSRMKKSALLYGAFLVVEGAALLLSFSRSAWLALLLGFFVIYSLQEVKLRVYWKYVLLVFSLFLFVLVSFNLEGLVWNRIFLPDEQAGVERSIYFEASKEMILENPWGRGMGSFTGEMVNYVRNDFAPWLFQPVHNVYMLVGSELGILGVAGLLVLFGFAAVGFYRQRQFLWIGILSGMATIMLFDHYFYTIYAGQFLLVFGLAGALMKNDGEEIEPS